MQAPALDIEEWVQGAKVDLATDASKKVQLVEFWATWCPTCKASVPKLSELQDKYKDNPQKMNQKLMEFMREHRVNPAGGCIPSLLQIPVSLGFYAMLQTAIELRYATEIAASRGH